MSHTSAKRWPFIEQEVSNISAELVGVLGRGEERFQQFEEIFAFAGGTDQSMADMLYQDINAVAVEANAGDISGTATPDQVSTVTDSRAAMTSMHQLYDGANNNPMTTADRFTDFRRMI